MMILMVKLSTEEETRQRSWVMYPEAEDASNRKSAQDAALPRKCILHTVALCLCHQVLAALWNTLVIARSDDSCMSLIDI